MPAFYTQSQVSAAGNQGSAVSHTGPAEQSACSPASPDSEVLQRPLQPLPRQAVCIEHAASSLCGDRDHLHLCAQVRPNCLELQLQGKRKVNPHYLESYRTALQVAHSRPACSKASSTACLQSLSTQVG